METKQEVDQPDKLDVFLDSLPEPIKETVAIIARYGQIDGDHHKTWVIDQAIRLLTRDRYAEFITAFCDGEDGSDTYEWDKGIAP